MKHPFVRNHDLIIPIKYLNSDKIMNLSPDAKAILLVLLSTMKGNRIPFPNVAKIARMAKLPQHRTRTAIREIFIQKLF